MKWKLNKQTFLRNNNYNIINLLLVTSEGAFRLVKYTSCNVTGEFRLI